MVKINVCRGKQSTKLTHKITYGMLVTFYPCDKIPEEGWAQQLMPVIPATQEEGIRRIAV
jgi:hypothetical protein